MCNCGKPKPLGGQKPQTNGGGLAGQTQQFTLTTTSGTQKFGSMLEAQAAAVRAGGGSISFG